MSDDANRLVWVDLEMTGLDPETCSIVEIATIITDANLAVVAEGPNLVVHQPDEVLATMGDFVRELHTRSSLLDRIRTSTVSLDEAAAATKTFVETHCQKGTGRSAATRCGSDRQFLDRYMPGVSGHLHYRMIDVSTVKEIVKRAGTRRAITRRRRRRSTAPRRHPRVDRRAALVPLQGAGAAGRG
jgi:oligoribonuclease